MSHDEPTLPEKRQAQVLADWLEGRPPAGEIPEDLDPDVIEAVLALRPELAPEPELSVDDILSGVQSGPLAAQASAGPHAPQDQQAPPQDRPDPVVAPPPTPQPANTPNKRWVPWAMAGLGSLAAAAVVLIAVSVSLISTLAPVDDPVAAMESEPHADLDPAPARDRARAEESPQAPAMPTSAADGDAVADAEPVDEGADEIGTEIRLDTRKKVAETRSTSSGSTSSGSTSSGSGIGIIGGASGGSSSTGSTAGSTTIVAKEDPADVAPDAASDDSVDAFSDAGGDAVADLEDLPEEEEDAGMAFEAEEASAPRRETAGRAMSRAPAESAPAAASADDIQLSTGAERAEKAKDSTSDLERRARPSSPPAGETQAVLALLDSGQPADARDQARQLLDGGGLSDLRRADLYWALGKAHQALGQERRARSAFEDAIRLRGR